MLGYPDLSRLTTSHTTYSSCCHHGTTLLRVMLPCFLSQVGGMYGEPAKPTHFIALILKMLQASTCDRWALGRSGVGAWRCHKTPALPCGRCIDIRLALRVMLKCHVSTRMLT